MGDSTNEKTESHLEVLKWAIANGAPWDDRVVHYARLKGRRDVLERALVNGAPPQ